MLNEFIYKQNRAIFQCSEKTHFYESHAPHQSLGGAVSSSETSSLKIFLLVAPLRKTKRRADLMKVYRGTRGRAMMIEDPQELPYSITCTSRPNIFLYTFSLSLCRRNQAVYMTTLILSEVIIANEGKKIFFVILEVKSVFLI